MENRLFRCNRCHKAPTISQATGANGVPAISIRCHCRFNMYRCDITTAKRKWNEQNQPRPKGKARYFGGGENDN